MCTFIDVHSKKDAIFMFRKCFQVMKPHLGELAQFILLYCNSGINGIFLWQM